MAGMNIEQFDPAKYQALVPDSGPEWKPVADQIQANQASQRASLDKFLADDAARLNELKQAQGTYNESTKSSPLDALNDVFQGWAQQYVANIPNKYATAGGILTNSLPDTTNQLSAMARQQQTNLQNRQLATEAAKTKLEQMGQIINAQRASAQAGLQMGNEISNKGDQLAMTGFGIQDANAQRKTEAAMKLFGVDRDTALKIAEMKNQYGIHQLDQAAAWKRMLAENGLKNVQAVAGDFKDINKDRMDDPVMKAVATSNAEYQKARALFERGVKEGNPSAIQQGLAAMSKANSGLATTNTERSENQAATISWLDKIYTQYFENRANGGLLPPDVQHNVLKSIDVMLGSNNDVIANRNKAYESAYGNAAKLRLGAGAPGPESVAAIMRPNDFFATGVGNVMPLDDVTRLTQHALPRLLKDVKNVSGDAVTKASDSAKGVVGTTWDIAKGLGSRLQNVVRSNQVNNPSPAASGEFTGQVPTGVPQVPASKYGIDFNKWGGALNGK